MAKTETRVVRLPLPEHLEPKVTARQLKAAVRSYYYALYNSSADFREWLTATGNKDAVTRNRLFDRHEAVKMIKDAAKKANDMFVFNAFDGIIYKHISELMNDDDIGLKLRRQQYAEITRQAAE